MLQRGLVLLVEDVVAVEPQHRQRAAPRPGREVHRTVMRGYTIPSTFFDSGALYNPVLGDVLISQNSATSTVP